MRRPLTLLATLGTILCALAAPPSDGLFNDGWHFLREAGTPSDGPAVHAGMIPASWEAVSVPHTPQLEPVPATDQWQGVCRYAKQFDRPQATPDTRVWLTFEGAMNEAQVWINGHLATTHLGGYLPFTVDLTDYLQDRNTLEVRLDNRDNAITGPKPLKKLDFNMYGGLYRNVRLRLKNPIHITDPIAADRVAGGGVFVQTDSVSEQSAIVRTKTHIRNLSPNAKKIKVVHTLSRKGMQPMRFGGTVAVAPNTDAETRYSLSLPSPILWSPETPALYELETALYTDGTCVDKEVTRIGIRDIHITPEGLFLNGKPRFLRGVNRHQEYPYVGYALSDNAQRRDAWIIKQAGFDYVRSSHYPSSPAFLDACDQYGILVLEPILGWQYFGDEHFAQHALHSGRELIRRDRNHPSILAWELSINEVRMPEAFIDAAVRAGHEEFAGRTYIAGWMKYGYDIYIEARQHRKAAYAEKPLIVSEYGDWEYFAMNAGFAQERWSDMLPEQRSSRQARGSGEKRLLQQATNVQQAHNDNLGTHAFADGYWAMFDYSRGLQPDLVLSGAMDAFRLPKYAYWFFRSQRDATDGSSFAAPMVRIASEWQPGVSHGVRVFSNCDEVALALDGRTIARQKPDINAMSDRLAHGPFTFDIDCTRPGVLTATGYIGGKAAATHRIGTPGKPARLQLEVSESGTPAQRGCNELLFVYATVTDADGNTVTDFNAPVTFQADGDASYIYTDRPTAEAGIASALLRIGDKGGKVQITASAEGLAPARIRLTIN